jgi:hypothetical protein
MKSFALLCVVPSLALSGCLSDHDCFQVEVKPDGDAFQRKLTCWHEGGKNGKEVSRLGPGKLVRIGGLYQKRETPLEAKKHVFTGRFDGSTPADVGGAGSYTHFSSPLGSASCYVERFRGNDNLDAQLEKRREMADRLAEFLAGWATAELGKDPNFPRLKRFLDEDFRRDLKNFAVYAWAREATQESKSELNAAWLVRAAQYFCERGYFKPAEVPALVRAYMSDDPKPLFQHVQRFLMRKMGMAEDRPVPASLGFLDDPTRLEISLDKYVRSPEFQKKQQEASKRQPQTVLVLEPAAPDVLEGKLAEWFIEIAGIRLFSFGADSLDLKLHCDAKPYSTNGTWDEKAKAVTWSQSMPSDMPLLAVCFALWSTPDRSFQQKHFGKLLLSGETLAEYAVWYRALKKDEAAEWDEFIAGLKPGPGLKAAVQSFRFRADAKPDPKHPGEVPPSLADTPRDLILRAMEGNTGG